MPLDVDFCVHFHERRAQPHFEHSLALAHPDKKKLLHGYWPLRGVLLQGHGVPVGCTKQAGGRL